MGGNWPGGWGEPPSLPPGRNIIPYGKHHAGRNKKPPKPPKPPKKKGKSCCILLIGLSLSGTAVVNAIVQSL